MQSGMVERIAMGTSRGAAAILLRSLIPAGIGACLALSLAGCGGGSNDDPPPAQQSDPLVQNQWHLQNTGQPAFSGQGGVPGIDLRVMDVFNAGVTGDGVRVLVLDDGLEIGHPDLKDQIAVDMLHNFDPAASGTIDPTPPGDESHGTGVGGIIGASANNGLGGRGIAPKVRLGGARFLCDGCETPVTVLDAYGGAPFSRTAAVINGSFGSNPTTPVDFDPDSNFQGVAIQRLATLREGKGTIFVKAAGNEYQTGDTPDEDCSRAQAASVTCSNTNAQPDQAMPQQLVVGSVNANGKRSSYSNAGASILVMGLGGEHGQLARDPVTGALSASPALISTDLSGCARGSVKSTTRSGNALNDSTSEIHALLNPECDYTATMNGTSSAAPTIAGVVALMLQANPQLTWRDVRYILMKTARQLDAGRVPHAVTLPSGDTYVPEPAWVRNGAGLWFDNWYGFGLADASAAVAMARSYTGYLTGNMKSSGKVAVFGSGCDSANPACGDEIPVGEAEGLEVPIAVAATSVSKIEAVQLSLTLDDVSPGDLAVELISPSGTRSVLMTAYSMLTQDTGDVAAWFMASYAFNEEPAQGSWTLRLIDVAERDAPAAGRFQAARLEILGH